MGMGGSDGCRNDTLPIVGGIQVYIYILIYILAVSFMMLHLGGLWASKAGSRCMETTIRRAISSPSTSGNNPRLSYIWMYVSWDRYRDTYLDIWVRRVIIIIRCPLDFNHDSSDDSGYDRSYVSCYSIRYVYLL